MHFATDCPPTYTTQALALLAYTRDEHRALDRGVLIMAAQIDAVTCTPIAAASMLHDARELVAMLEQRAAL